MQLGNGMDWLRNLVFGNAQTWLPVEDIEPEANKQEDASGGTELSWVLWVLA